MDVIEIGRYLGALILVLGLVGFAAVGARRFALHGLVRPAAMRRLKIVETLMISPRQRICLIRRDEIEHLVAISDGGIEVIERGIPAPPDSMEPKA